MRNPLCPKKSDWCFSPLDFCPSDNLAKRRFFLPFMRISSRTLKNIYPSKNIENLLFTNLHCYHARLSLSCYSKHLCKTVEWKLCYCKETNEVGFPRRPTCSLLQQDDHCNASQFSNIPFCTVMKFPLKFCLRTSISWVLCQ